MWGHKSRKSGWGDIEIYAYQLIFLFLPLGEITLLNCTMQSKTSLLMLLAISAHVYAQVQVTIKTQIRNVESYKSLSICQQLCVAGRIDLDPSTDSKSAAANTGCNKYNKECFCGSGEQTKTSDNLWACMQLSPSSCGPGSSFERNYNAAISWIGNWCGYQPVLKAGSWFVIY